MYFWLENAYTLLHNDYLKSLYFKIKFLCYHLYREYYRTAYNILPSKIIRGSSVGCVNTLADTGNKFEIHGSLLNSFVS